MRGAGLIIAVVASSSTGHATSECAWYFVAYTFDTTLGVTIAILLHRCARPACLPSRPPPLPSPVWPLLPPSLLPPPLPPLPSPRPFLNVRPQ